MASEIVDRILADIKDAMKTRDKERLLALRFLHSEIKNRQIADRREITDEDALAVIAKSIKSRKDAIEQFRQGEREDLVEKESFQLKLLEAYQGEMLGEAEVESIVDAAIEETGASSRRDMGTVMKAVLARVKGRADGKLVSSIVGRKLG